MTKYLKGQVAVVAGETRDKGWGHRGSRVAECSHSSA